MKILQACEVLHPRENSENLKRKLTNSSSASENRIFPFDFLICIFTTIFLPSAYGIFPIPNRFWLIVEKLPRCCLFLKIKSVIGVLEINENLRSPIPGVKKMNKPKKRKNESIKTKLKNDIPPSW